MEETYIWRHAPMLSAPPKDRLAYYFENNNGEISEVAIFELENGMFLYILYHGMLDNPRLGITDVEEFDSLEEAFEYWSN